MLSVLIPHWDRRGHKLAELLRVLLPQAEAASRLVEIVALRNSGGSLPEFRQALLDDARGMWMCYVDDDDMVPPYYVNEILSRLIVNPDLDYIGFLVERAWDNIGGCRGGISTHSLRFTEWTSEHADYTLLNPVRTSIACQGSFLGHGGNHGEDHAFRDQIIDVLRNGQEAFINKIMYHYRWDLSDSVQAHIHPNQCPHSNELECQRNGHELPYWRRLHFTPPPALDVRSPVFRWHERSIL